MLAYCTDPDLHRVASTSRNIRALPRHRPAGRLLVTGGNISCVLRSPGERHCGGDHTLALCLMKDRD
jgi:hypothetical protein